MGLCMLIMFPIRGTGGILIDVRNSSLLFGSFFTRTVNPAAWTCTASYMAPTLATLPAPLAGERGEELVLAQPHRSACPASPLPLFPSFLLTAVFVQIAFGSSLDPKIQWTEVQQSQPYYMLSPALSFILSSYHEQR